MKLTKRILKLELEGESAEVRYPTVKEHRDYAAKVSKAQDTPEKVIDCGLDLLISLGLPKQWAEELEQHHMESIMGELFSPKK